MTDTDIAAHLLTRTIRLQAKKLRRAERERRRYQRQREAARKTRRKNVQSTDLITDYARLVEYLIARRQWLGWSAAELDERAGFTDGYATKLENWRGPQGRVAGAVSMELWLSALGVGLMPVTVGGTLGTQRRALEAIKRPRLKGDDLVRRVPR